MHRKMSSSHRRTRRRTLTIAEAVEPRLLFAYPPMAPLTSLNNPFNGIDIGFESAPALGDVDGDGDLDAVIGTGDGTLVYFRNTGKATAPFYAQQTGGANPFNAIDVGTHALPALRDFDGDGDLDMVVGAADAALRYYRNTGNVTTPGYAQLTGGANPFNSVFTDGKTAPTLGDLDGDGDLDAVVGQIGGILHHYRNVGTTTTPSLQFDPNNPLSGIDLGDNSTPSLADMDGDGDADLLVGESTGTIRYFKNIGSAASLAFVQQTGTNNPFNGVSVPGAAPAVGDLDRDGDLDALAGSQAGTLSYFRNDAVSSVVKYTSVSGAADPFNSLDIGNYSMPVLGDIDIDGDRDLLVGTPDGTLRYFKNNGTSGSPVYVQQTGASNPFNSIDVGEFAAPALGGLSQGVVRDLLVGAGDGTLWYYKRSGPAANPVYTQQTGAANPFNTFDIGSFSTPTFGELTGNTLTDVLVGSGDGAIHYFENTGPGIAPVLVERTGTANPWGAIDVGETSAPTLADADNDSDLDLTIGARDGTLLYFRNTSGNYALQTGTDNPFDGFDAGSDSSPALGDADGDGDLDVIVGSQDGTVRHLRNDAAPRSINFYQVAGPLEGFGVMSPPKPALGDLDGDGDLDALVGEPVGTVAYFRNIGNTTSPVYAHQSGAASPFNGFDIGAQAAPAFGDLDADGDTDVIVGENNGGLQYWRNNGTATNPAFQVFGVSADVGDLSTPTLGDLDGDGDLDFVVGAADGTLHYFKNVGTATAPSHVEQFGAYVPQTNTGNPFNGADVGGQAAPTLGDVDGDGDLDLAAGRGAGALAYFRNTGTATTPAFAQVSNPFGGITVGSVSAPALGDLDHDGDLDAIVEGDVGVLNYFVANRSPVVDNPVADQIFTGPGSHSYTVPAGTFLDLDKNTLTYTASRVGGAALPAWLSFNPATRTFSGNPSPTDASLLQIRVSSNDGVGGVGFEDFQLSLVNIADNSTHVTTPADENNGNADPLHGAGTSLREAINFANTLGTNPEITFDPSLTSGGPATITLGGSELAVTGTLEISGPGANLLTISGNHASRILNISASGILIGGVTLANGSASLGGAILNSGTLNLSNSVLRNNTATSDVGGAIASSGSLSVSNTTFTDNNAVLGGAINSAAALNVNNCTFTGNDASFNGGALRLFSNATVSGSTFDGNSALNNGGAIMSHGNLVLTNCTIANNSAPVGAGLVAWSGTVSASYVTIAQNTAAQNAGGLWVVGAPTTATNVIVAGNTAPGSGKDLVGTLQPASSNNLLDMPAAAAGLGALAGNGGSTQTIALLPSSPAINAGATIAGIAADQRGVMRPQGASPDIGAYERQSTSAQLTSMTYEYETRQAITFLFNGDASVVFGRSSYSIQNLTTGQTLPADTGTFGFNVNGTRATLILTNLLPNADYRISSGSMTVDFFVLAGDANHDHVVDFDDYVLIDQGYNNSLTGFSNGDFNYDGVIDFDDYVLIDLAFNSR